MTDREAVKFLQWLVTFVCINTLIISSEEKIEYPEGYYAFQEATPMYKKPPKVRKPPYYKANVPCPGATAIGTISPRDTLCGDLNKGFIPMNPMGHTPFGEPYPFDVIKNKTLNFLSRLLPYLKRDINKVTKVARFVGAPISYREPGGFDYHQIPLHYNRQRRSVAINGTTLADEPVSGNITSRALCDNGSTGILCSVSKAVQKGKIPLAVISALAESLSATKTTTPRPTPMDTKAQLISLLATIAKNSLNSPTKAENKIPDKGNEDRSPLSHIMSIITGADSESETKFNPVSFMIDLVANTNSPLTYLSNLFPSRRRPVTSSGSFSNHKPIKDETSKIEGLPPTPCPSLEDYVTPTFARNYQGVWKYVVQVPNEGYFTQTVQQTKCVRNRCDFTDGVCHESPRWVSLLVAEVFYPNTYFPTSTPSPTSRIPYDNEIPPIEDFHNFQQYLRRRVGESERQQQSFPVYHPQRQVIAKSKETCDGRDDIGCYIVRVYYDWFLINGSCKCWMPTGRQLFKSRAIGSNRKGNT